MRSKSFIILSFFLSLSVAMAQGASPDALEQLKRDARKNDHIERALKGKIIGHLYKGRSKALYAFVFKSEAENDKYYHVKVDGWEGAAMMPFLPKNESVELTVTGDPVLLERLLYPAMQYQWAENQLGIRLDGLAHFKNIKTNKGSYEKTGKRPRVLPKDQSELVADVVILSKKKTNNDRWAYVLGNDDTLYIREGDHGQLKNKRNISYIRSVPNIMNHGVYYKAPNSYYGAGVPYLDAIKPADIVDALRGKIAVVVEKSQIRVLENEHNRRGLFNGMKVSINSGNARLFFDAKNGEVVKSHINDAEEFTGYYKIIGEDSLMLFALEGETNHEVLNNTSEPFSQKSNYYIEEVKSFTGKISVANFLKTKKLAKIKYFVVSDSVYVGLSEVVAINIQNMIKEGREVTVSGYIRKDIPGEVNMKGYTIMAANAITIKGKTFKQNRNIKNML